MKRPKNKKCKKKKKRGGSRRVPTGFVNTAIIEMTGKEYAEITAEQLNADLSAYIKRN